MYSRHKPQEIIRLNKVDTLIFSCEGRFIDSFNNQYL